MKNMHTLFFSYFCWAYYYEICLQSEKIQGDYNNRFICIGEMIHMNNAESENSERDCSRVLGVGVSGCG
jgi:hypothetical protein